jgi:hypothetical protein
MLAGSFSLFAGGSIIELWRKRGDSLVMKHAYRFSVYRLDIHAGESGYVAEERYRTVAEVLAHPYQPDEEYSVLVHSPRRWMSKEDFEKLAAEQYPE